MGKPLTLINLDILENFRRMCVRDLRVDDMQDSSIAHDEEAQRTILARFYAYHHYLRANPDQAERLCSLCPVSGFQAFPAVRGVFKGFSDDDDVWDTDVTPIDILLALPRQNTQTPKAIQKEILGLYGNIVTYLTELRGIASHESDLERALRDAGFMRLGDDRHPIVIRLLLHLAPTKGQRKTIERAIDRVAEDYPRGPTLRIQFGDDIDYEVRNTESTFQYVPQGELVLDQADNRCEYREGACRAMFVNVRAQSLRNLWKTCATRGLLAQNLRYYVSLPRVDNAMLKTMALEPKQFWYLNNGLTIVCDTYETHGNTLRLRNFSIVNGGQTTHNIGTVEELPNDFALPCKIIALEDQNRQPLSTDNRLDFIADVCTATNSQKPIKAADAVANRREIRELRRLLKAAQGLPCVCKPNAAKPSTKNFTPNRGRGSRSHCSGNSCSRSSINIHASRVTTPRKSLRTTICSPWSLIINRVRNCCQMRRSSKTCYSSIRQSRHFSNAGSGALSPSAMTPIANANT